MLPRLSAALEHSLPDHRVRFRIDRGAKLREGLVAGRGDLALLLGPADDPRATQVGELDLTWYSGHVWRRPPAEQPIPLVSFDNPCVLRSRALETLSLHAMPAVICAEAIPLAGVQAAVGAGLGDALMATVGQTPEGLTARNDLPKPAPLPLAVWSRQGLTPKISQRVAEVLRDLLAKPAAAEMPVQNSLELAKGA